MIEPIHVISCGGGVQSSKICLAAARGEYKDLNGQVLHPKAAIFADTQAEPKAVMQWLDYLEAEIQKLEYPFPLIRVTRGSLRDAELRVVRSKKSGKLYLKNSIPAFVSKPDGKKGLLGRRCTSDFKIVPLQQAVKRLVGVKRGGKQVLAKMWVGISTDEAHRMKPSRVPYIENMWPLIDVGMSRRDCLDWMKANGYPEPPRSACTFCPFHSDEEWLRLKSKSPEEFESVVQFERQLQAAAESQETLQGKPFLHESMKPIDQVDFDALLRPGRQQINLFGNECEGLCGV